MKMVNMKTMTYSSMGFNRHVGDSTALTHVLNRMGSVQKGDLIMSDKKL